jgi:hypothetical protein
MDLIDELKNKSPDIDKIYDLITYENLEYVDDNGNSPLMYAFEYYGEIEYYNKNEKCDPGIFHKMLDVNPNVSLINNVGDTVLMVAFSCEYYNTNKICDSSFLLRLLDLDCNPEMVSKEDRYKTALIYAFEFYGENENCDSKVFLKLLDLDCEVNSYSYDYDLINSDRLALDYAIENYYLNNENCDYKVIGKLLFKMNHFKNLCEFKHFAKEYIDENDTIKQKFLCEVFGEYKYLKKRMLILNRINKRMKIGKKDSSKYFDVR